MRKPGHLGLSHPSLGEVLKRVAKADLALIVSHALRRK
jgi:hypothetical protein